MTEADQLDTLLRMEQLREALAGGREGAGSAASLGELASSVSKLGPGLGPGLLGPRLGDSERVAQPRRDTLGDGDLEVNLTVRPVASHLPLSALSGLARSGWSLLELQIERGQRPGMRRLCVRYQVPEYSVEGAKTLTLDKEPITLELLPTFARRRVLELRDPVEALLRVEVERMGTQPELLYVQTFPFWLLPMSTAVVWLTGAEQTDLRDNLTCWVTPSAPEVLATLRAAVELTPDKRFTGYADQGGGGVAGRVRQQVRAIFEYLKSVALTYVSSDLAIAGPGTIVQRVRSPKESLADRAANCIDGTVLYASLLLAVGIEPALVLLPGHALLGWRRNPGATDWSYLETVATRGYGFDEACEQGDAVVRRAGASVKIVDVKKLRGLGLYPAF